MSEEWGPWIDHDGRGCPCRGMWVQVKFAKVTKNFVHGIWDGSVWEGRATGLTGWNGPSIHDEIICYRIRKPKGLTILEMLLENLTKEVECVD